MNTTGAFCWNRKNKTMSYMIVDKDTLNYKVKPTLVKIEAQPDKEKIHTAIEHFVSKLSAYSGRVNLEFKTYKPSHFKENPATKFIHDELINSCEAHGVSEKRRHRLQNILEDKEKETEFRCAIENKLQSKLKKDELYLWEIAFHVTQASAKRAIRDIEKIH